MEVIAFVAAALASTANLNVPAEPQMQSQINVLVERDRPRDLLTGSPYDPKTAKRFNAAIAKQNAEIGQEIAEYSKTHGVRAWRKILDSVNQGGLRSDDLISGNTLRSAFLALHELGPPVDDIENGNNAEFTARRHHAMMRLLAIHMWQWHWSTPENLRVAAGYLQDCERRPDSTRSSGNHHDPNCGFHFEMGYKLQRVGDRFWEDSNLPQTFSDFAAGVPSSQPTPIIEMLFTYSLLPQANPNLLWPENEAAFVKLYARPYIASREVQEQINSQNLANRAADAIQQREQFAAAAVIRSRLEPKWQALWSKNELSWDEQVELENLSASLNRLAEYRTRYRIISYDRIDYYCRLGWTGDCNRKDAIDAADRAKRAGPDFGTVKSGTVNVRSYDQNGNYLGSTTTTRIDAELAGARPY